jgi:hypothetical protein
MRCTRVVVAGVVALLSVLLACSASASGALVLKSAGQVAPVGTTVLGQLNLGPCGTIRSSGTLTANSSRVDVAKFSSSEDFGGGCGEGGPEFSGTVRADRLTETGRYVVVGSMTYTTTVPERCDYSVKRLHGKFTIPGPTEASVSGTGKRTPTSKASCPETASVEYVHAKLLDSNTNELLQAEL